MKRFWHDEQDPPPQKKMKVIHVSRTGSDGASFNRIDRNFDWIEIELRDSRDKPIPHARYRILSTDGADLIREGELGDGGLIHVWPIPTGTYIIEFPDYDQADFEGWYSHRDPISVLSGHKDWIEIQLVDESFAPIREARYEIRCPDGKTFEGRTNRHGLATVLWTQPGDCEVIFPDFDETDLSHIEVE